MGRSDSNGIVCKKTVVKQCIAIVPDTGRRCLAQAVNPNTFRTTVVKDPEGCKRVIRTDIVNNPDYCQMHQPDKIPKYECKCPYCPVHNPEGIKPVPETAVKNEEVKFSSRPVKKMRNRKLKKVNN